MYIDVDGGRVCGWLCGLCDDDYEQMGFSSRAPNTRRAQNERFASSQSKLRKIILEIELLFKSTSIWEIINSSFFQTHKKYIAIRDHALEN